MPQAQKKTQNATSGQAPGAGTTTSRPVAAGSATLTDAQAQAKAMGLDPALVSDQVDELLSLEQVDWKNDKAYMVRYWKDAKGNVQEVSKEIVGATRSKAGIVYSKEGKMIGFINMPKTSKTDRIRHAISLACGLVKQKTGKGKS